MLFQNVAKASSFIPEVIISGENGTRNSSGDRSYIAFLTADDEVLL